MVPNLRPRLCRCYNIKKNVVELPRYLMGVLSIFLVGHESICKGHIRETYIALSARTL